MFVEGEAFTVSDFRLSRFDSKRLCAWRKDIDMQGWLDSLLPCVSSLLWPGYKWDHAEIDERRYIPASSEQEMSSKGTRQSEASVDDERECKRIINASSFYAVLCVGDFVSYDDAVRENYKQIARHIHPDRCSARDSKRF